MLYAEPLISQSLPQLFPASSGAGQEADLEAIARQEAAVRDIRERIVPMDLYVATNTSAKGRFIVQNSNSLARLGKDLIPTGESYSYSEVTVYDFDKRTITTTVSGKMLAANRDPVTGEYRKGNGAVCAAQFSYSSTTSYYSGQLGNTVGQLKSAYQAEQERLNGQFSGGELDDEIKKLTGFYAKTQTELSVSFSGMIGGFLEHHGQSGQTQKIYGSVQSLFVEKYQLVAAGQNKPHDRPILQELDFAGVSVAAYQAVINSANKGDEVRQAVKVAMVDMKVERMHLRGGSDLLEAFRNARPSIHDELLDAMDKFYEGRGEKPDRDLFGSVYDKIMHSFRMSGDALTAVGDGVDGVWDSFYRPAYQGGMYETLAADWQDFLDTFETPVGLNAAG